MITPVVHHSREHITAVPHQLTFLPRSRFTSAIKVAILSDSYSVFDTGTGVSVDEWFMQKIEKERK